MNNLNKIKKATIPGIILIFAGFIVLFMVNRKADNWAGYIAPALFIAGWIVVGIGLYKHE
ncbi:MAG: hypothetical protein ACOC5R_00570 [Elusimicrobiota bacterium]